MDNYGDLKERANDRTYDTISNVPESMIMIIVIICDGHVGKWERRKKLDRSYVLCRRERKRERQTLTHCLPVEMSGGHTHARTHL